jgi:hypothetical protein
MDRSYLERKLQEAEAELGAARTRTHVNEVAKKVSASQGKLKRLEIESAERPKRKPAFVPVKDQCLQIPA